MIGRPPISTRTDTLFPYTTLFRSGDISFGTLFGPDKQFGIVLATNYSKRTIESQNAQSGGHWDVVDGFDVQLENKLRQYHIVRERTGLFANFDWRPTDTHRHIGHDSCKETR